MKKLLSIIASAVLLFSAASCSFLDTAESNETQTETEYGRIAFDTGDAVLTDIVLKGTDASGTEKTFGSWTDNADLKNAASVKVPVGNWNFTLTLKKDGVLYSGTASAVINKGETATVVFEMSCSEKTAHLVKFNAADTVWADTDMTITGSASSGGKEGYLVLNHKIDLEKDDITIEADVKFSSLSGHVGLGFIAVDGSNRKAYSLLSGQNIKNVSCSLGGGGNGLTPAVSWSVDKTYHFKAALSASTKEIIYTVTDEAGTESINKTPIYHDVADVVYPALGGTTAENASYSNIKIAVKNNSEDTTYTFDGLDEQDVLSALSVNTSAVRLLLNGESTVTYTSTAKGEASGVNLEYDNSILEVTDDGNGTLTVKGIKPSTGTTLKVINKGATYITATISVVVEDFNAEDGYGALTTVYPAANADAAFEDGEFRITFDDVPAVSDTGSISIYDAEGNWVDTIKASNEVISVTTGKDINVKNQMIRVEGNSVYFTPHYGVLEAGKTYYIAIPKDVITAKLNGKDFTGLTNDKDKASWKFTTRAAVPASSTITVDGKEDSTANFRTIHGALLAIGTATGDYTIKVAPGTYREIIHFNGTANITITGTGSAARGADTVIQWTNLNKWNGSMDTRSVMYFGDKAGNVVLNNITIKNTCDRAKEGTADTQAEAFYYKSTNKVAANNCTFLSHQDTICTKGKTWFYNCYIEGDTDFIWGYSDVALFEKCDLVCLYDSAKSADSNYSVLFVARTGTKTAPKIGKGYVLLNSTVTVKDGVTNYLGRNAGSGDFYDQIALVNVAFTNEGTGTTSTDLWRDANVYDYLDGKEDKIGLKFYNLTGNIDTSAKIAHVAELSADAYAKEFNGRRAILNRVYNKENDEYELCGLSAKWDLTELELSFEAEEDTSVDEDSSSDGPIDITWDFQNEFAKDAVNIQAKTGVVADPDTLVELQVDATTGKLASRGGDAQFNTGAIIKVPVSAGSVVTVVSYPGYHSYTVAGTAADADSVSVTAEEAGFVEIVATGSAYLYKISVTGYQVPKAIDVKWDFQNEFAKDAVNIQAKTGVVADPDTLVELQVDATTGKLASRGGDAQFNTGAIIKVPVSAGSVVTVVSYPGYHSYTVAGTAADADSVSVTAEEAGFVEIVATGSAYLYSIAVTGLIQ